eukprot:m51a1_g2575 putative rhodanese domain protein (157) ;mRNA; f:386858-387386
MRALLAVLVIAAVSHAVIPEPDFAVVLKHATAYLAGPGRNVMSETVHRNTSAFFVVDIRAHEDYCKGHVPGAVNIPFKTVLQPASLAQLPKDRTVLLVCYTGHTASQATALLGALGYDTRAMFGGMLSWSAETDVSYWTPSKSQTVYGGGFEVETC